MRILFFSSRRRLSCSPAALVVARGVCAYICAHIAIACLRATPLAAQLSPMPLLYGAERLDDATLWLGRGAEREAQGRLRELLARFPASLADERALLILADAQFRAAEQNPDELAHALTTVQTLTTRNLPSPFHAFALEIAALRLLKSERFGEANEYFARAALSAREDARISPESGEYERVIADALYWRGVCFTRLAAQNPLAPDSAETFFSRCALLYPQSRFADDALFALGRRAENAKMYDSALVFYERIVSDYPRGNLRLAAHLRAAQNHLQFRRSARALAEIENANAVAEETMRRRANADENLHAQAAYLPPWRARGASGNAAGVYFAEQELERQRFEKQGFEEQDYADNARETILYLRGEANALARRFDVAAQSFDALLNRFPASPLRWRARLGKGYALLHNAADNEAIQAALNEYDAVIEADDFRNPEFSRLAGVARLYRGIALKRKGDRETARKELGALAVRSDFPFPTEALLELGELYYDEGKYDEARKTLERAAREAPDAATQMRVNLLLGATALETKNFAFAARAFERAETLLAQIPLWALPNRDDYANEALLKRGVALVGAKEYREAIAQLTRFLNDNPPEASDNDADNTRRRAEASFWIAEAQYQADLLLNSARGYQAFLNEYQESERREEAMYGLGWAQFRLRQFTESAATFTRLLREYPQSSFALDGLTRKGDGLYITKNYRAAADAYRQAQRMKPKSEQGEYAAFQLGQALYRLQEYDQALEALRSFAKTYPSSSLADDALYGAAWIYFQQRRYEEAAQEFRALVDAYPQASASPRAYYALGDAYFNMGQYDEAIRAYRAVADFFPLHALAPEAVNAMQYCYLLQGKDDSAAAVTDAYINASPGSTLAQEVKFKRAETFFNAGKFATAAAEFEDFIKKNRQNPRNADALYQIGRSYAAAGDTAKAFAAFRRVEDEYPQQDAAALAALEAALLRQEYKQFDRADSGFARLEREYPHNAVAMRAAFERAVMRENRGDTLEAISMYRDVAERYAGLDYGDRCRYRVAMFFRAHALFDSARAELRKIAETREDDLGAEAQYRIGELYLREKRYNDAVSAFLRSKTAFAGVEDWYTLALLNLGACYEELKQKELATEMYRLVIAQHGDDDFAKTAQTRLDKLSKP